MREDLGAVYPGDTLPCCAVNESVEIDTHHGEIPCTTALDVTSLGRRSWVIQEDVTTDIPHGQGADESTVDETISSTEFLDEVERKENHAEGFGDAVEACCEELGVGTADAERFEDAGRVVGDDLSVNVSMIGDERLEVNEDLHSHQ